MNPMNMLKLLPAAITGRLQKPVEIRRAQLRGPARLQHPQRARVLNLLFLRIRRLQKLDALGRRRRALAEKRAFRRATSFAQNWARENAAPVA